MNTDLSAFDWIHRQGESATRPLARLAERLPLYPQGAGRIRKAAKAATNPLSLVVAGTGLPPPRFAATPLPDAPSGASNYGF